MQRPAPTWPHTPRQERIERVILEHQASQAAAGRRTPVATRMHAAAHRRSGRTRTRHRTRPIAGTTCVPTGLGAVTLVAGLLFGCSGETDASGGLTPDWMHTDGPLSTSGQGSPAPGAAGAPAPDKSPVYGPSIGSVPEPPGGLQPPQKPRSPFVCSQSEQAPEHALSRLSGRQYRQRIRDLVEFLAPDHSTAVLSDIHHVLAALPPDLRSGPDPAYGGLRRLDQSIYAEAVDGTYAVAVALGGALTSRPERLRAAAGTCAVDAASDNDSACADAFIHKVGRRALRRPLTPQDLAFYREAVQDSPISAADYADIVALLVSSPFFLYAVELGSPGSQPRGKVALTAHELAARLALHFWHSAPDDELRAAADSGALLDDQVYRDQVERVYANHRTRRMLEELFVDWLEPQHLEELHLHVGSPDYDALRGDFTPGPELRSNMLQELGRMGAYYAHRTKGTFADLFQSRSSFAETPDLAEIYGVPVWDGEGEPPSFPQPRRQGLLTRAALVATGHSSSHPIFKGVYARKTVLCETIPPPPADASAVARDVLADGITSRAVTEALSSARADCAACHTKLINPIGFTLEHFDGLGRFRSVERVFDPESGELIGEEPVNAKAVPRVLPDDLREARGPADLHRFMLESGKPQVCFVRRYFRYTFARREDDTRDGCMLDALLQPLLTGQSLGSALRAVALRPEFRHRSYEP